MQEPCCARASSSVKPDTGDVGVGEATPRKQPVGRRPSWPEDGVDGRGLPLCMRRLDEHGLSVDVTAGEHVGKSRTEVGIDDDRVALYGDSHLGEPQSR